MNWYFLPGVAVSGRIDSGTEQVYEIISWKFFIVPSTSDLDET